MKTLKRIAVILFICLTVTLALPTKFINTALTVEAHSGRTDSSGGHHDYNNKSGLGSYHYHHGMGPHLHPGGVCPYSGSSSQSSASSYTPPSPSISIKNYPTSLIVGESSGFEYSVSNATSNNSSVSSSDTSVIKVNPDNTLTAVSEGTAQITIKVSGATKSFTVKVTSIPVEKIEITNEIDRIQLGEEYKYNFKIIPDNATNKQVICSSDNEDILEINNNGNIKTKLTGVATITVMAEKNIEVKTTVEVFEVLPESIECHDSVNLIVGDIEKFEINILPENSNNKKCSLKYDDDGIVEYSDDYLKAIAEGETMLHIETWNGISKDIPIKIDIIPVEKIDIADSSNYMFSNIIDKSGNINISANIYPDNATYQDIEWFSSNDKIISVNNGHFTINGTGEVTLTCVTHDSIKDSINIIVIDKNLIIITSSMCAVGIISISIFAIKKKRNKKITI